MATTNKRRAGWAAIALTVVAGFEGLRQAAYLDPVGIPTICFGETKGVRLGQRATLEQCDAMLAASLQLANHAVDDCIRAPLPDYRRAALVSFTYNVGQASLCGSTLARKLNAGDVAGGCDELLRWTYAKGIRLPGLVKRRAVERNMCLGAT
ncbi:glycoside hydrolase family protein [Massilia sp. CCM 8733]|uniref:Lysozyme n=1 Tax=Massilia mucilaginosa TaxID=2609282 RepID=A0ABX0P1S4_9BURK|nr:lysozyme [Massilia mucilaginosa]NHZ93233.1 glycoside hydrolase family protein [Massilia mucilaginosa]